MPKAAAIMHTPTNGAIPPPPEDKTSSYPRKEQMMFGIMYLQPLFRCVKGKL